MLHWSQEASTGWTRNSWVCSLTKRDVPFRGYGSGANGGSAKRRRPGIYHRTRRTCTLRTRRGVPSVDAAGTRQLPSGEDEAYVANEHEPGDAGSVTASEFSFLALGLVLGLVSGAALIEFLRARPGGNSQVRVTVSPDSVPRRRASTLADAFVGSSPEPARGGPADRRVANNGLPPGMVDRRTSVPVADADSGIRSDGV